MGWVRPANIPLGTIWREFEGKSKRKYWVQDVTEEYKDAVVNFMVYGFQKDEPMSKYGQSTTYREVLEESSKLWRELLNQNVGLLCLTKDDLGNTQIAAMNCTVVSTKDEKDPNIKCDKFKKIIETCEFMSSQVSPFEHFKVDKYLSAMGLYVLPEFRREGIGIHVLKAREALCKALNVKVSCTVFTSIHSQIVAEKAGYKDLYTIAYADLPKKNPRLHHPGIEEHTEIIKFMYIVYE